MSGDFPKLLVATEFPPNASGGGPAVVRQMLKGWPVEKLCWWSCLPDHDQLFGQKTAAHRVATIPSRLYPHRRWPQAKSWVLEHVWTRWAARHVKKTITALQPEAVWVIPHAWAIPPLARVLQPGNIVFHTSVHDYPDTGSRVERFGLARSRWMASLVDRLYSSATTRDAISQPMIADLRARTGSAAAQIARAGLEEEDFAWLSHKPDERIEELRIAYAGTIIAEEAFGIFVEALSRIRKQLLLPVSLELFGNDSYRARQWFDPSWMRERDNLAEPALTDAMRKCAWGFSPMSLTDDDPRYNRYSFPTKFISYLAAGLPVITLGHRNSSVVQMAEAYGVGLCTQTSDVQKLAAELLTALSQREAVSAYRPAIVRCARAEFDARKMRAVLHECLRKCAQNKA
ncbi:MAG: hypothetical protein HY298_07310 [Verrucomicrobia bacterium]|nr:hypothetical protein [Verrucomicrobiota bacterium]